MGKKLIFTFVLSAIIGLSLSAQRIAYVDIAGILNRLPEYQTSQKQIDDLAAQWRSEIAQEYDKIKGMYNAYQAEQVLLSDDARKQREDEIMAKEKQVRDMQKEKFGPEGALFKKRQELVNPIQERVYSAIQDYANDKGFDFIFDKSSNAGMIFTNERYDKTEDILQALGIE